MEQIEEMNEEEKDKLLKEGIEAVAKILLAMAWELGAKNHITSTVHNEPTNETWIIAFIKQQKIHIE